VAPQFDLAGIEAQLADKSTNVKLLHVQRSCGYQWRPSISIAEIERLCTFVKRDLGRTDVTIFVDNCYGELVEAQEPCHVGVTSVRHCSSRLETSAIYSPSSHTKLFSFFLSFLLLLRRTW